MFTVLGFLGLAIVLCVFTLRIYVLLCELLINPLIEEVEEIEKMIGNFQRVFCPTPEQLKEEADRIQKMIQRSIDNHDCYYCKHARLEPRYEHGKYAGHEPWCTIDGRDEYCGLIDQTQMCMFWEYDDPENR